MDMKKWMAYWLPVIVWAGVIFYSSSQPYKKQDLKPTLTEYLPLHMIDSAFSWVKFDYAGDEVSIQHLGAADFVQFFIRKFAHFSVYFILAFLLYRAIRQYLREGAAFILSLLITVLYAASDEFHQHFTGGRSPHVEDVILDSVGGLIGLILAFFIYKKIKLKK